MTVNRGDKILRMEEEDEYRQTLRCDHQKYRKKPQYSLLEERLVTITDLAHKMSNFVKAIFKFSSQ